MAKYDVAARFQEVAKRARETGPIHTGAPKKKPVQEPLESKESLSSSFHKQMGTSKPKGGDVNLPINTGPNASIAEQVYSEFKKKKPNANVYVRKAGQ